MTRIVDVLYLAALLVIGPVLAVRAIRRGRRRGGWRGRLGLGEVLPPPGRPRVLLHAVSVGEVNAVRRLVDRLRHGANACEVVVATTTDTGFARARVLFTEGDDGVAAPVHVVRYPLDLSPCVRRMLDRVRPDVVGLVELEVWPNFTAICARRGIPLVVVSGRLSARSFERYRRVRPLVRPSFARLDRVLAQGRAYADRFVALGTPGDRVEVSGSMKWDVGELTGAVPGADELAALLGLDDGRPLVVAGSTAPDEHALLHAAVGDRARLLCAPRRPEWFDDAVRDLPGAVRRSTASGRAGCGAERIVLDTIGELRQAYARADVVVVGRSFGDLHGSDPIEPVALGKPVVIGPAHGDFDEIVEALAAGGGLIVSSRERLAADLRRLLDDPGQRRSLAEAGRAVIGERAGATARTADALASLAAAGRR